MWYVSSPMFIYHVGVVQWTNHVCYPKGHGHCIIRCKASLVFIAIEGWGSLLHYRQSTSKGRRGWKWGERWWPRRLGWWLTSSSSQRYYSQQIAGLSSVRLYATQGPCPSLWPHHLTLHTVTALSHPLPDPPDSRGSLSHRPTMHQWQSWRIRSGKVLILLKV